MFSNEGDNIVVSAFSRHNISGDDKNNNLNFNSKNNLPENQTNIVTQGNTTAQKPTNIKLIIILITVGSALVATGVIVPAVVLSNKNDDEKTISNNNPETNTNTEILSTDIYIERLKQTKYCIYSILQLKIVNLNYHPEVELTATDISLEFPIEGSTQTYNCDAINDNIIEKKIPPEVISGKVILSVEKLDFTYTYEFTLDIIKEIKIKFQENIKYNFGSDMTITDDSITRCKNNYSIVYSFISPAKGIYDVELSSSIYDYQPKYLYADIDYDLTAAIRKGRNIFDLVKKSSSTRNTDYQKTIHGSFYLEENKEYFVKIAFLKNVGMHTYNINGIRIIPNENQNKKTHKMGFALYKIDCQNEMFYPFYCYWSTPPNNITIHHEYIEFYYNQEAYDNHYGQRHYKGAEITAYFSTIKDGWYGYKFCLLDLYPKNANTSIINQIFNTNRLNTWAGHFHMRQDHLWMTHRSAAYYTKETHYDFGQIEWNTWYNLIIYFKVGLNNKGLIKVWLGKDKLKEDEPTYVSGGVDFGFGSWIDDETLDNTKVEENGKINQILCKFGMYTWDGGDKRIKYANISALEYNPEGAFDIVNPSKDDEY